MSESVEFIFSLESRMEENRFLSSLQKYFKIALRHPPPETPDDSSLVFFEQTLAESPTTHYYSTYAFDLCLGINVNPSATGPKNISEILIQSFALWLPSSVSSSDRPTYTNGR